MTNKEMIEARCKQEMLPITGWEDTDDGETATIGGRWRVVSNEEEDYGLYEGDEGVLTACVVGSVEYANRRVHFGFKADGYDEGNEVHSLTVLDPVT